MTVRDIEEKKKKKKRKKEAKWNQIKPFLSDLQQIKGKHKRYFSINLCKRYHEKRKARGIYPESHDLNGTRSNCSMCTCI